MMKFPNEVKRTKLIKILMSFGFKQIRHGRHLQMKKIVKDGENIPLTIPNKKKLSVHSVRRIIFQANISREEFLEAYYGNQNK